MAQQFNVKEVDPSVSAEELELATQAPSGDFPITDVQDLGTDPDAVARGLAAITPRTPAQAMANLRNMREHKIPIGGVGLCWYDVRENGWGLPALWPTAQEGGLHGAPIHRFSSFADAPRGMTGIFENDHVWHVVILLGGGLCNTSDYHENGFNGVATIAKVYDWCGAHAFYGIETVNGYDVYPTKAKKPHEPKPWSLEQRLQVLEHDEHRAKKNDHPIRAERYAQWVADLEKLLKDQK